MWEFVRRHKGKVHITLGAFGSGLALYKLYDARAQGLNDLEKQLSDERKNGELVKERIRAHFESVRMIVDSTTLPRVMKCLENRITEHLDLSPLMERLMQGKGQTQTLTTAEKLELWERLKILSFSKMISSLLSMTLLTIYIKVQVNILSKHLYVDTSQCLGSSHLLEKTELIDKNDEQEFLSCADYLCNHGLSALISNVEASTSHVLSSKQLKEVFCVNALHDTIIHILDSLLSTHSSNNWAKYLMPEDLTIGTKAGLLLGETRAVMSSAEFSDVVDISLRTLVNLFLEDLSVQCGENHLLLGMPLAKLIAQISKVNELLLDEPNRNRYVDVVRAIPEVELFFTLLSSSTSS